MISNRAITILKNTHNLFLNPEILHFEIIGIILLSGSSDEINMNCI